MGVGRRDQALFTIAPSKSALCENFRPGIGVDRFHSLFSLRKESRRTTMTIDRHNGNNVTFPMLHNVAPALHSTLCTRE